MAAGVLHIPLRTLTRRKGGRLDPQESERLMRLVRLRAQAEDVLGTRAKAIQWLEAANRALGGASPLSLLDTDIGTQAAQAVLTRIVVPGETNLLINPRHPDASRILVAGRTPFTLDPRQFH